MTHLLTFYKTLKFVDATASLVDVKTRYKQLALLFHPDKAVTDEEKKTFPGAFSDLKNAYDIIVKHLEKKANVAKSPEPTAPVSSERKKESRQTTKVHTKPKTAGKQDNFYDDVLGNARQNSFDNASAKANSKTHPINRDPYSKTSMNSRPPPLPTARPSTATSSSFSPHARFNSGSGSNSNSNFGPPSSAQSFPSPFMSSWSFADSDPLKNGHSYTNGATNGASASFASRDKKTGYERNAKHETHRILELSLRDYMCGAMRKIPSNKGSRCKTCFSESEPITMCTACNGRGPRCSGCGGSGAKKDWHSTICNHCSGQGKIISCTRCNNRGYCLGNCVKCCNTRGVSAPDTIIIHIVPGKHFPGTIIRLIDGPQSSILSSSESSFRTSSVRDIVLRLVNIGDLLEGGTVFGDGIPRPLFKALGSAALGDLTCTLPIQLNGILLGCQLEFRHLNGNVFRVNTPEGHIMSPSECLVLEGQGMARPGGGRGRLFIALKWQMPTAGDVELMRESLQHLLPSVSKPRDRNGVIGVVRPEVPPVEIVTETLLNEREIIIDVSSTN